MLKRISLSFVVVVALVAPAVAQSASDLQASVALFQKVAATTGGLGHLATGVVAFFLVVIPTTLMGATLPLLVAHATNRSGNVGRSVGNLYFVNTLGAAFGAYLTVRVLLGLLGLSATVKATAGLNASLGLFVLACHWPKRRAA